jgi:hypothetical protein
MPNRQTSAYFSHIRKRKTPAGKLYLHISQHLRILRAFEILRLSYFNPKEKHVHVLIKKNWKIYVNIVVHKIIFTKNFRQKSFKLFKNFLKKQKSI